MFLSTCLLKELKINLDRLLPGQAKWKRHMITLIQIISRDFNGTSVERISFSCKSFYAKRDYYNLSVFVHKMVSSFRLTTCRYFIIVFLHCRFDYNDAEEAR